MKGNENDVPLAEYRCQCVCVCVYTTGNPCTTPEKPFPCRNSDVCIPLLYLCDDNPDCDDAYDEDPAVCTAGLSRDDFLIVVL